MSRTAEDILEFDRLRDLLRRRTTCAPGRGAVDALSFSHDRSALESVFALIAEAVAYSADGSEMGFGSLADPERWLAELESPVAVLTPAMLLDSVTLADTAAMLRDSFRDPARASSASAARHFPLLSARAAAVADLRPLAVAVRRAVLPNGEISDDASPQLRQIRASMGRTRETIQKSLERMLRSRGGDGGEDYVTLRNDRFVIPVRAAERRQVQGVVHAASATGQTVFVEPFETIEHNNRLVQLGEEEAAEINRILDELSQRLRANLGPLRFAVETIAELDSVFARARFAREFDCTLPQFTNENLRATQDREGAGLPSALELSALDLKDARHPVLADTLRAHGRSVVPMTLALGGDKTVLVISGPNTGGKTVALKTVGLAVLSAQSGIPVAAESARLPIVDRVLVDIGDEQSIAADLSTFSAHMLNVRAMLEAATPQSLVLVDELGTGTAPEEGAALAVALLDEFRERGCLTLATTHHDRLKTYASTSPGVLNAAVEFDEVNLRPTYRLLVGVPGGSSGIDIARRLGLPTQVIDRARAQLSPEAHEAAALIAYLHRSRDELETLKLEAIRAAQEFAEQKKHLQTEWTDRQRTRLKELEHQFAQTIEKHEKETARAIEAVKERELRAQLEKQTHRKLVKARSEARDEADAATVAHLADSQADLGLAAPPSSKPVAYSDLVPGARIRVRGVPTPVTLRRRDASGAEVEAGPLRMKVALADITAIVGDESGGKRALPQGVTVRTQPADEPSGNEINLIGCTVEEATRRVDKFIDQAALAGAAQVRIIHGHGTGALRRGLAEFLKTHPLVGSIRSEAEDRGGQAITLVELKD
ncbi:MAG TPA: Smr/MutS family protein [Candidatus Acidoferrales bacterium]|nr:Smr/MutS family protein [Candidatus Acidoferrales bacterium]